MDIYVVEDRTVGQCRLQCCRVVITFYQKLVRLFPQRWQRHHLMTVSIIEAVFMIRKFTRCVAAALCCLPVVAIAASDNPKELEGILAKVRSEPMIFVVAAGSKDFHRGGRHEP